jgi:hypothetical protein
MLNTSILDRFGIMRDLGGVVCRRQLSDISQYVLRAAFIGMVHAKICIFSRRFHAADHQDDVLCGRCDTDCASFRVGDVHWDAVLGMQ